MVYSIEGSCRIFLWIQSDIVLIRIYFHRSLNIGIYSQNKKYYTDNQDEQLINIGTGSGDTYFILEGDLKD